MTTTLWTVSVQFRRCSHRFRAALRVYAEARKIWTTPVLVGTVTGCILVLSFRSMLCSRMIRLTVTIGQSNDGVKDVISIVGVATADEKGDDSDARGTARVSVGHRWWMTVMQPLCATWARGNIRSSRVRSMVY